mgnify:CR=1 FL=1
MGKEYVACDLCGSDETTEVLRAPDRNIALWVSDPARVATEQWVLVRCRRCGLTYLNPRPTKDSIGAYYPAQYYAFADNPSQGRFSKWQAILSRAKRLTKQWLRRRRVTYSFANRLLSRDAVGDPIVEIIGFVKPGKVLDVGCGAGSYLDRLKSLGWETYGIEINQAGADIARGKGHKVWIGDASSAELPRSFFDVAVLSHVLEHLFAPREVLIRIREAMASGGIVIVDVPNWESPWSRLFGQYNWALDLPRHLYHFEQATLLKLVSGVGFTVRCCTTRATPRFLCWSLALMAYEKANWEGGGTSPCRDIGEFLRECRPDEMLDDFCRALESHGWGNQLRLVAVKEQ